MLVVAPPLTSSGVADTYVAAPPLRAVMPTMLSTTPTTVGSFGMTSATAGLTPSTPRIGTVMLDCGPIGPGRTFVPSRVSRMRDGVIAWRREPFSAPAPSALVDSQPNTSITTSTPPLPPNRSMVILPPVPRLRIAMLETNAPALKLSSEVSEPGREPVEYAARTPGVFDPVTVMFTATARTLLASAGMPPWPSRPTSNVGWSPTDRCPGDGSLIGPPSEVRES